MLEDLLEGKKDIEKYIERKGDRLILRAAERITDKELFDKVPDVSLKTGDKVAIKKNKTRSGLDFNTTVVEVEKDEDTTIELGLLFYEGGFELVVLPDNHHT